LKEVGYTMNIRGAAASAADVYEKLVSSINNVYDDVKAFGEIKRGRHASEYELFHNDKGVVDGPW
jgi:hypothetical protein